tara:strand:- start:6117 stop:6572 length:456 start_codon:yes stop_codon:yes gene_type:complete
MPTNVNIKNRKASYAFQLIDKYIAGIVLLGTEIKSLRNNQANISDAYCSFIENELWVNNLHIDEYTNGGYSNHIPKRARKLLLNKQELMKMDSKVKSKGMSIIPIRLFINDKGKAKIEIALAKGKNLFDKRESIKQKDIKRDLDRINHQKL